jgi:hypothetical protein
MEFMGQSMGIRRPRACIGQSVLPQHAGGQTPTRAELPASIAPRFAEADKVNIAVKKYARKFRPII